VIGEGKKFLPPGRALAGRQVLAMQIDQPVPGELAQPGIEGQGTGAEVLVQVATGLEQGILDNVGGIQPGLQATVQAGRHHELEAVPKTVQQKGPGAGIALTGRPEQILSNKVWVWLGHNKTLPITDHVKTGKI
jgi:hypothetical protein